MNAEALKELFEPFGAVMVKRMFGGHGVYADGLCFAIEAEGEVFLKVDPQSEPSFAAAGSSPFIYHAKGRPMTTSYWLLPPAAHDDPEEMRRWAALGLSAARRAAEAKTRPAKGGKRPTKGRVKRAAL